MIPLRRNKRDVRHRRGDRPHQRVEPADRNAEHRRPIAALGARPDGDAVATAGEEPGDADHQQRRHDQRDQVVGVEDDVADRQLPIDRWRDALAREIATPPSRDEDADHDQQLGDAERRDRDHQSRRVAEAADQRELDHDARDDRHHQAGREAEQVRPTPEEDERGGERGRHRAELGLGEVDHPIGAIDQRHADSHHGVQPTERHPVEPQPEREPEEDELYGDDGGNGCARDKSSWVDVADPRASHATTVAVRPKRRRRLAKWDWTRRPPLHSYV